MRLAAVPPALVPPPPPMRSLVLDLLLLTVVAFPVAPLPPPPPPMRSTEPPKPGTLNCAQADPGAITKAVVTTASNTPLKRMPMATLPKSATAPCRLAGLYSLLAEPARTKGTTPILKRDQPLSKGGQYLRSDRFERPRTSPWRPGRSFFAEPA